MSAIPFHSPSSVNYSCDYAWALRYIMGVKMPDIPWEDFASDKVKLARWGCIPGKGEAWPIQRSASLGKEMHARWEQYYCPKPNAKPIIWTDLVGQIMVSGKHLLPRREHCTMVKVEEPIGSRVLKWKRRGEDRESIVWDLEAGDDFVAWNGYKDLVVRITREECDRLGCYWTDGYLLLDHKTTSSIAQYAKINAALRVVDDDRTNLADDLQCCLYALEVMAKFGLRALAVRWVYYETKDKRQAIAVDELITIEHAWEVVDKGCVRATTLERIKTLADAKYNTKACDEYGGCKMHQDYGGPCKARKPIKGEASKQRKQPSKEAMASIAELRAKQAAKAAEIRKSEPPPAAAEAEEETAQVDETDEVVLPDAETVKPRLPVKRTRKPAAVKVEPLPVAEAEPEAEPEVVGNDSASDVLLSLAVRRSNLLAELADVNAEIIAEVSR